MLEIPEAATLAVQLGEVLTGKIVNRVLANDSPHKFAWFTGQPETYDARLGGLQVTGASAFGGIVVLTLGQMNLAFSDGVNLTWHPAGDKLPAKHQLCMTFDDGSTLIGRVQMYGGMTCFQSGENDNLYFLVAQRKPSPLTAGFDQTYFLHLFDEDAKGTMSMKAFLATEQRIPGLGNGVLQDILHVARIHPKRKTSSLTQAEKETLYHAICNTLIEMTAKGGRDVETDLFGCCGGYQTRLSKLSLGKPCVVCGGELKKENYMGGSIYYCSGCQVMN